VVEERSWQVTANRSDPDTLDRQISIYHIYASRLVETPCYIEPC